MELHFSHASRVLSVKPTPLETTRISIANPRRKLARMFNASIKRLTKTGELSVAHERLVDRRPVEMKPSTTEYNPPQKAKVRSTQAIVHDHPWLTATQRGCRTATTMGKPVDMTNKVAEQREARRACWIIRQSQSKS